MHWTSQTDQIQPYKKRSEGEIGFLNMDTFFQNPYKFIRHWFAHCCGKLTWKCFSIMKFVSVLFLNQNAQWAQRLGGRRRFLNNLDFKQPDAALSPHHRFSHGSRSPTLIYNPQRGFPHPLTPSLLNACRPWKPTQITWGGGVYRFVLEEIVVGGCDYVGFFSSYFQAELQPLFMWTVLLNLSHHPD